MRSVFHRVCRGVTATTPSSSCSLTLPTTTSVVSSTANLLARASLISSTAAARPAVATTAAVQTSTHHIIRQYHRNTPSSSSSTSTASVREPVVRHYVSPPCAVPANIVRPFYATSPGGRPRATPDQVYVHTPDEIAAMRRSNALAHRVRQFVAPLVKEGVTTDQIDRAAHNEIIRLGAYPSPLGYAGFPKSIATSVNEIVCHGIPDSRPLQRGDVIKIDTSLYFEGFHGDCCATFFVGEPDEDARKLNQFTKDVLAKAISICKPGVAVKEVGRVINMECDRAGYGIVTRYCGHGVGKELHMFPIIEHCYNENPVLMRAGMIFTIEPMVTEGSAITDVWKEDGWTVVTRDRSRCAQWEDTILITPTGAEVLTK